MQLDILSFDITSVLNFYSEAAKEFAVLIRNFRSSHFTVVSAIWASWFWQDYLEPS